MENPLKYNGQERVFVYKTFKIKIQKRGLNNSDFLQNWLPPRNKTRPFYFVEIWRLWEKSIPELCKMHWYLMNDEEFGSRKLLKFK